MHILIFMRVGHRCLVVVISSGNYLLSIKETVICPTSLALIQFVGPKLLD